MNDFEKNIINDSVGPMQLGLTEANAARGQTASQEIETPVELMEFERHESRIAVQSLYRRGRQGNEEFRSRH